MTKHETNFSDDHESKRNSNARGFLQKMTDASDIQRLTEFIDESTDIDSRLKLIEKMIHAVIDADTTQPDELLQAAYHLIRAGGKRFRSLLVLLSCEAVGGKADEVLPLCVATEFLQTASLIHDDIIDRDEIRRGVQTVHEKFGLELAILATDYLIFKAYSIIGKYENPELVTIISGAGEAITSGETAELFMHPTDLTIFNRDEYLKMVQKKTGAFIEGATHAGALIGNGKKDQIKALVTFGRFIGLAFQIRDDILDIAEIHRSSEKVANSDLNLKRANLPLILALEALTEGEVERCIQALETHDYSYIHKLLVRTDAVAKAMAIASSSIKQALAALEGIALKHRSCFGHVAEIVLSRTI
jgi:geranylgeranyl diphosphate synthase type I